MAQAMLGKLPLSAVRGPRDTLEEHLAGPDGPRWLEALKRFNRKENPWKGAFFFPQEFFRPSDWLFASDSFQAHVLDHAKKKITRRGLSGLGFRDLPRPMSSIQVVDEVLGGAENGRMYALTLDQVGDLIDLQRKGEEGDLLLGGGLSLFYAFVERQANFIVASHKANGKWGVHAVRTRPDDLFQAGGTRVFFQHDSKYLISKVS